MTNTNKALNELSKFSEMQEQFEREYEAECDQFWNNLSYDDQLKAFFSVCKRIYQGDVKDRRSYRGVLYDTFNFESDAYGIGMQCGYMHIHNLISEGIDAKEIMKDHANSMKEDYTKSGDET
jgi:hypothetical protein